EIGADRRELAHGGVGIDFKGFGVRIGCTGALALAAGIDQAGLELDLEVSVDRLLAGAHVFGAPEIALGEIDELVVEIAVEDRGDERQRRDEHREKRDHRDAKIAVADAVAHGSMSPACQATPPSSRDSRSAT